MVPDTFYSLYVFNNPTNRTDPTGFNPYVIVQSLSGRKASFYAGLDGLGRILVGNAAAFGGGCAVGAAVTGQEFRMGNIRIAPLGNRTGHPTGRYPHYHRGVPDPKSPGNSLPGQSPRRHRPWDTKSTDKTFLDRF